MNIILASASPRRSELMQMLGVNVTVIPAKGEEHPPENAGPEETVSALSLAKAREVAEKCGCDDVIIAADTIVWHGGRILGKPHSEDEAKKMLMTLSGGRHEVYTGVTVIRGSRVLCEAEVSQVYFRNIEPQEIDAYIATGEPMDKAGSYGAQGKGAIFVERIDGDFFNVMGLPLCRLAEMLKKQGVEIL